MFCSNCGTKIYDGDKFCTQCGTPALQEHLCPNCQSKLPEGAIFCGQCGTKVKTTAQPAPAPVNTQTAQPIILGPATEPKFQPSPIQPVQPVVPAPTAEPKFQPSPVQPEQPPYYASTQSAPQNMGAPGQAPTGSQLQKHSMISKYVGEPTVGIAKATGTLTVYSDRLEYAKVLGNALGNVSLVTMAAASHSAKKNGGKVETYYYQDIKTAYVGKYMGVNPAVVLLLNDGQTFSFNGTFTNQSAANIVNTILYYKSNH